MLVLKFQYGCFFPECVAKGSRFTSGVWGLGRVRSTLLSRLQVFASDGKRPQQSATARDEGSAAKVVTFGGFKCRVTSFPVLGGARCDIPTCFITSQKSFCVTGAILLRPFQKMSSCPSSYCKAGASL